MTPQESQLVTELFDRLVKLEIMPRDAAAERLIADGLRRAPHAVYALVQAVLLQDEALKRANARIEELQAQPNGGAVEEPQPQGSFLDSMRDLFGGREPKGSVPQVRPQGGDAAYPPQDDPPQNYPPQATPPGYPGAPPMGSGGSFLGTAASTAAGMIGSALLLDGIRAMFGHHPGEAHAGALTADQASPWSHSGSAADSQLARDAGIDHIGDHAHDTHDATDHPADADDATYQDADDDDDADADDDDDDDDDDGFGDDDDGGDGGPDDGYDG